VTRYVYSTVRIVPRVGAGEAVNFAVIAGSDQTGEWEIRGSPGMSVGQFAARS
jgi:Protein of unknown function (DUF3037)